MLFLAFPCAARASGGVAVVAPVPGNMNTAAVAGISSAASTVRRQAGLNPALFGGRLLAGTFAGSTPTLASVYAAAERFKASVFAGVVARFTASGDAATFMPTSEMISAARRLNMPSPVQDIPERLRSWRRPRSSALPAGPDVGPVGAGGSTRKAGTEAATVRAELSAMNSRLSALRAKGAAADMTGEASASFDGAPETLVPRR